MPTAVTAVPGAAVVVAVRHRRCSGGGSGRGSGGGGGGGGGIGNLNRQQQPGTTTNYCCGQLISGPFCNQCGISTGFRESLDVDVKKFRANLSTRHIVRSNIEKIRNGEFVELHTLLPPSLHHDTPHHDVSRHVVQSISDNGTQLVLEQPLTGSSASGRSKITSITSIEDWINTWRILTAAILIITPGRREELDGVAVLFMEHVQSPSFGLARAIQYERWVRIQNPGLVPMPSAWNIFDTKSYTSIAHSARKSSGIGERTATPKSKRASGSGRGARGGTQSGGGNTGGSASSGRGGRQGLTGSDRARPKITGRYCRNFQNKRCFLKSCKEPHVCEFCGDEHPSIQADGSRCMASSGSSSSSSSGSKL